MKITETNTTLVVSGRILIYTIDRLNVSNVLGSRTTIHSQTYQIILPTIIEANTTNLVYGIQGFIDHAVLDVQTHSTSNQMYLDLLTVLPALLRPSNTSCSILTTE